jgi:hypothetical protein
MNPYWFGWMSARILVITFNDMFNREMGRKSFTVSGLSFFGTRVMWDLLMHSRLASPEEKLEQSE